MVRAGEAVRRVARIPGVYLSTLFVGLLATITVVFLLSPQRSDPVPVAALMTLGVLVLSLSLWLRDPLGPARSGLLPWFLVGLACLWSYQVLLMLVRDERPLYSTFVVPVALVMIALRTPLGAPASDVMSAFAWAVVAVCVLDVTVEALDWLPRSAAVPDAALASSDQSEYFLPLSGALGLDGRWAGPFGHPNLAGPMGAFVLVVGLTRRGAPRIVLSACGLAIVLLTGSRSSLIAALVGVVLLSLVHWATRPSEVSRLLTLVIASVAVIAAACLVIVRNPGLTGRATLWPAVVDLWRSESMWGIGSSGFRRGIEQGRIPEWATHAHNVVLDAAARTGIVGLVLCLAVIGLAVLITLSAARRGHGLGLALVGMLVTTSMTDNILLWTYLTGGLMVLMLAVLVSAPSPSPAATPRPQQVPAQGSGPDRAPEPIAEGA